MSRYKTSTGKILSFNDGQFIFSTDDGWVRLEMSGCVYCILPGEDEEREGFKEFLRLVLAELDGAIVEDGEVTLL